MRVLLLLLLPQIVAAQTTPTHVKRRNTTQPQTRPARPGRTYPKEHPGCTIKGKDHHCMKSAGQAPLTVTKQLHDLNATPTFLQAGSCAAPQVLSASLVEDLYFFAFVTSRNPELLRHFLAFYSKRGVRFEASGRARLVVSPVLDGATRTILGEVHPSNIRVSATYTSDLKRDAVNEYLRSLPERKFLMYPDLDEFFDLPSATLDEARARNGFVLGTMVDRIARDWRLSNVTAAPLHVQFPRRCIVTLPLLKGQSRKWILVPTSFRGKATQFMSSHYVEGEDALHFDRLKAYGFSHYRFGAKSVALLRDKLAVYGKGRPNNDFYERVRGYLADREGTAGALSGAFQQSVQCLENCPASPPPHTPVADRRPLA